VAATRRGDLETQVLPSPAVTVAPVTLPSPPSISTPRLRPCRTEQIPIEPFTFCRIASIADANKESAWIDNDAAGCSMHKKHGSKIDTEANQILSINYIVSISRRCRTNSTTPHGSR